MEIEHTAISQITFINDEIPIWNSILRKLHKDITKVGFNRFSKKEKDLLLTIKSKYDELYEEDE